MSESKDLQNASAVDMPIRVITPFHMVITTMHLSRIGNLVAVDIDGIFSKMPSTDSTKQMILLTGGYFTYPDGTIGHTEQILIEEPIPKNFRPARPISRPIDIYADGARGIGSLEIATDGKIRIRSSHYDLYKSKLSFQKSPRGSFYDIHQTYTAPPTVSETKEPGISELKKLLDELDSHKKQIAELQSLLKKMHEEITALRGELEPGAG